MLSHLPGSTHPITSVTGEKVYSEGRFLAPPPTQITPPSSGSTTVLSLDSLQG